MSDGFEVLEQDVISGWGTAKEDKVVLPAANGVKVRVDRATVRLGRKDTVKALNLQVRFIEGIPVEKLDAEGNLTGEFESKYANKVDFIEIEYKVVDKEARKEVRYTGENQAFLVPLKQFLLALGYDPATPVSINDEFCSNLIGKTFLVNVGKVSKRVLDPSDGEWKAVPGEYKNTFKGFKAE